MITSPNAAPELHIGTRRRKRANQLPQLGTSHRAKGLDFPVRAPLGEEGGGRRRGGWSNVVYNVAPDQHKAETIPNHPHHPLILSTPRPCSVLPPARCRICSPARRQNPLGIMSALMGGRAHGNAQAGQ